MKLVGGHLPPTALRVAISLDLLGLPYEVESLLV